MLGSTLGDQNVSADSLFYDDSFEDGDEDEGSISDCSTNYSYGSDPEVAGGSTNLLKLG